MTKEQEKELDEIVIKYLDQCRGDNYAPWMLDSTGLAYPRALARLGAGWMEKQLAKKN